VPPLIGAALNLPWWATLLLILPGTVWYLTRLNGTRITGRSDWDSVPIAYALPGVLAIALVVPGLSGLQQYTGCFAASLLILADMFRGGGDRKSRRGRHQAPSADAE
jgi:hypothetical protein